MPRFKNIKTYINIRKVRPKFHFPKITDTKTLWILQ